MSKVQISTQGTIDECIDDLAMTMLQHDRFKEIVLGAAVKYSAIQSLGHKANAEIIVNQMKEYIKGN